ncbi:MAG: hypothetical protein RL141_1071 [Candidatus Parcubacteria bacterium]|jgi:Tfp pilus assembly protein PilV
MSIPLRTRLIPGFSLLETLIYVSIFSVIMLAVTQAFLLLFESRHTGGAQFEVIQNLRFASEKVRQVVYDASVMTTSGACPLNTLEALVNGSTTTVSIVNGAMMLAADGTSERLTSTSVTATTTADCLFTVITNPAPASPSLQFRLSIRYNDNGNPQLQFSDSFHTTISQR